MSLLQLLPNRAADKVLHAVATRLRGQIRKFDMVARLGGDEFGLLLDGMRHRSDAQMVAQRVVEVLRRPIPLGDMAVSVGGSVGVAVVDDPMDVPATEELLRRADMAGQTAGQGSLRRLRHRRPRAADRHLRARHRGVAGRLTAGSGVEPDTMKSCGRRDHVWGARVAYRFVAGARQRPLPARAVERRRDPGCDTACVHHAPALQERT
jgi:GGDEF domain-containing protein